MSNSPTNAVHDSDRVPAPTPVPRLSSRARTTRAATAPTPPALDPAATSAPAAGPQSPARITGVQPARVLNEVDFAAAPAHPLGPASRAPALDLTPLSPVVPAGPASPRVPQAAATDAVLSLSQPQAGSDDPIFLPRPATISPAGAASAWRRPPSARPSALPRLMCPCTPCRPPETPGYAFPTGRVYNMDSWRHHIKAHFSTEEDFALLTHEEIEDITFIANGHGLGVCLVCRRVGSRDCIRAAPCRRTSPPPIVPPAVDRTWRNGRLVGQDVRAYRMDRNLSPGAPPPPPSSRVAVAEAAAATVATVYDAPEPEAEAPPAAPGQEGRHWRNVSHLAGDARRMRDPAVGTGRMDGAYIPLAPAGPSAGQGGPSRGAPPRSGSSTIGVTRRAPGNSTDRPSNGSSKRARVGRSRERAVSRPLSTPPGPLVLTPEGARVGPVAGSASPSPGGLAVPTAASDERRAYTPTPLSALPTDDEFLRCPLRSSDVYDAIPSACLPTYEMLILTLLSKIVAAPMDSAEKERAWRIFFLTPVVVARRTLRGEAGSRSIRHQEKSLRLRILRAHSDDEWDRLWQEMIAAEEEQTRRREDRYASRRRRGRQPPPRTPSAHATDRATRLAKRAAYGRATRALAQASSLPHDDPAILERLRALHPAPPSPVVPIPETSLPLRVALDPAKVARAVRKMDATSSSGADYMPVRTLHLVAQAQHTPRVGHSGLELLTAVCTEVLNADVPASVVPLLSAARLIPLDKGNGKIRPVAIGGVLRRLVTKIAIADDVPRNVPYLLPEQVCSGVRSGGEAMFHAVRELMDERGDDSNLVLVSIDASNAFNRFSRQKMLDLVVDRCPALARFVNMIYGGDPPALMYGCHRLDSREGAQQGDPAAMLLFSLVIQPILKALSEECPDLLLTLFYADDGTLVGTPEAVARALAVIEREGPSVGYHIKPEKSKLYWPTMSMDRLQPLLSAYPALIVQGTPTGPVRSCGDADGVTIFGAPLGSDAYIAKFLAARLDEVATVIANISAVPDPRLVFHMQRTTASVCRFTHLARLLPTALIWSTAVSFDQHQRHLFTSTTGICLTPDAQAQLTLPARLGGLGLTSLRLVCPIAHASSLLDTVALRARWSMTRLQPTSEAALIAAVDPLVDSLRPQLAPIPEIPTVNAATVAAHPTHNQKLLTGALFERRAATLWRTTEWRRCTGRHRIRPDADLVALRARYNALTCSASVAFISASYADTGFISPPVWTIILRRFLGLNVYMGPQDDLWCPACAVARVPQRVPLDRTGHHSLACDCGYGMNARHKAVVRCFAFHALRPDGIPHRFEVPLLVPHVRERLRPADIYIESPPESTGGPSPKPHALDITVASPHPPRSGDLTLLTRAAHTVGGRAEAAAKAKISKLRGRMTREQFANLSFAFHPIAFDTYATPAPDTSLYIGDIAKAIARNSGAPLHLCLRRIYQQTSFAIWATVAQSILIRDPTRIHAAGYTVGV